MLELGSGDRKRIWMLLPNVEANRLEYFAYQGSNDESKNVLGPKGYISKVNQEALCGVSDWKVPNILQLKSLASGMLNPPVILVIKVLASTPMYLLIIRTISKFIIGLPSQTRG